MLHVDFERCHKTIRQKSEEKATYLISPGCFFLSSNLFTRLMQSNILRRPIFLVFYLEKRNIPRSNENLNTQTTDLENFMCFR